MADMVVDKVTNKVANMVAGMVVDKVADEVANWVADRVAVWGPGSVVLGRWSGVGSPGGRPRSRGPTGP